MTTTDGDEVKADIDRCRMCNNDRQWHRENRPRHPFTPQDGSLAFLGDRKKDQAKADHPSQSHVKVLPGLPSDPALRILMIELGLITQDQLTEVENRIRQAQTSGNIIIVTPKVPQNGTSDHGHDLRSGDRGGAQGSLWPSDTGTPGVAPGTTGQ
jgi:hypothetical protein